MTVLLLYKFPTLNLSGNYFVYNKVGFDNQVKQFMLEEHNSSSLNCLINNNNNYYNLPFAVITNFPKCIIRYSNAL